MSALLFGLWTVVWPTVPQWGHQLTYMIWFIRLAASLLLPVAGKEKAGLWDEGARNLYMVRG